MSGARGDRILLAHGGGGQLSDELFKEVIHPRLANRWLDDADDAAVLESHEGELAFTTDSYVVRPLTFPGGDIGRLAVCGTVNDLAVCGAKPAFLTLGLILEEGLSIAVLEGVLDSVRDAAAEAGVQVVSGDTKVVARGQADGMYVNTAGVGRITVNPRPSLSLIQPGDEILLSGRIAEHGLAVMLARDSLPSFASELQSDVAPLGGLVGTLCESVPGVRFLRDPTRGGLAGVCSEIADRTGRRVEIREEAIPIGGETRYVAEMLGLDPLSVANEGKVLVVVASEEAGHALEVLRCHPLGADAAAIGRISENREGLCELITRAGGRRILLKPYGEDLPRIC